MQGTFDNPNNCVLLWELLMKDFSQVGSGEIHHFRNVLPFVHKGWECMMCVQQAAPWLVLYRP